MTNDTAKSSTLRQLRRRLRGIASRMRALLLVRAVVVVLSIVTLSVFVLAGADYFLRLPEALRVVTLVGIGLLIVRLVWKRVLPAWRTRLSETDVALIVEDHEPGLRGLLAGAIDLERSSEDADEAYTSELRAAAVHAASRRLEHKSLPPILRPSMLTRPVGALLAVCAVVALIGVLNGELVRVGAMRILTPWQESRWPVRYAIWDVTPGDARAVDVPVSLRALVGRESSSLESPARALVTWRMLDASGDAIGDWSKTLLMPQRKRDAERSIPIYEQLIDPRDRASRRPEDQRFTLEYRINTRDDRTGTRRITLVRPPKLVHTRIDLELPAYAQSIAGSGVVVSGTRTPQQGEARVAPVLEGTRVRVRWTFSKPIADDASPPQWIDDVLSGAQVDSYTRPDERSLELVLFAREPMLIEPSVADRTGVPVREPISLVLEVIEDLVPSVRLIEPSRDEHLTPAASIRIAAELGDDLGLVRARMWAQRSTPPEGSSGAPPEPVGEPVEIGGFEIDRATSTRVEQMVDFSTLGLFAGDELRVWVEAWDLRGDTDSPSLGYARSGERVLRIVAEEELIERVRRALDPVRNNLRSLDIRQGEVQDLLRDGSPRAADEQRSLSERLRANQNALDQLADTMRRNTVQDETLRQMIDDASRVIEEAARQSERADDQIRRGEDANAEQSQRQVRNRLGELLSMLDQGQDAWLALRNVQQLRAELEAIHEQTEELAQRTAGQSLDEMSQDDRSALEQILERQLENAEDARNAVNSLDERADDLQENDPTQAEALRRAARQARAAQIEQRLQEAGAQIEQNQTSSAAQTQEEVLEELEEMLEELENSIQNRDNALRRELASIIDALKQLIDTQEREIIRLDGMILDQRFDGMDERLIALVRNTLSVRDEALGAFPETRSIADHITRAGNAQSGAINSIRANPPEPEQAQLGQNRALGHLRNALEEAERLDDQVAQRQMQRARDELRKAYEQALDTQTRIHDETSALGDDRLDRRSRSRARALGGEQETLAEELAEMLTEHEGLSEAPIFSLAHDQLETLMARSAEGLSQRSIAPTTRSAQRQSMTVLASLIDVLGEQQQQQEDFEDGSQSEGSGSGGSQGGGDEPLIPPVAELKLLRSMQQLVMEQTRAIAESGELDDAQIESIGTFQRRLFEQGSSLIESMSPPPPQPQTPGQGEDSGNSEPIEPVETGESQP
ncbi:MAG: coiled-coil domain-containing protein [Phycisphaerales bacterium]